MSDLKNSRITHGYKCDMTDMHINLTKLLDYVTENFIDYVTENFSVPVDSWIS
jgi:hypothetical protein